ncbi:hypothetical protein BG015_000979 [Linnemannia schmuckeri]|uniref:Transcription elongation factor 1 homolog n=1 Tax=Linnemannia schmuckeri TaxID=64567 RepID=A0A9P5VDY5_9FUNG|nr:hypothetical protein BG015_000979 [Linnemannia schmuckeri]
MAKPSLFSKRRSLQRRNTSKRELKLDKIFDCLACHHSKSVICKLDFDRRAGTLICEICSARYSCLINHLSKEVDVYSEWVDSLEQSMHPVQPKPRPQATTVVKLAPAAATHAQAQEPWVRPSLTKTSSHSKATSCSTATRTQTQERPRRDQSRSPISRDEAMAQALAPVHDRPNREQSHSPLSSSRPQAQTPAQTPTHPQTPVQVQAQSQPQVKEYVAVSVSPYHDQNEDNASQVFQQGGMVPAPAARSASITATPGQSWVQGNSRHLDYASQQRYSYINQGYNNNHHQQGYDNKRTNNQQGFGNNHNQHQQGFGNNNNNQRYDFHIQGYGFINYGVDGNHGFGDTHQGYGNNEGFAGNQGHSNIDHRFGGNQGYGNHQGFNTYNQESYGSQLSPNYNHNNLSNEGGGYGSNNNTDGGNFSESDAYSPAYDYASKSSGIQYNTTGGYSDY